MLERARSLVAAGRAWQARDLLTRHVEAQRDVEALTLLGHVLHGMGDLPRAGAAFFASGTRGPEADEAVAAWREQAEDDFARMWHSLPEPFRAEPRPARIEALHARARAEGGDLEPLRSPLVSDNAPRDGEDGEGPPDGAQVIGWIVGALFVACAAVGFVTVLGWFVPG